MTRRDVLKSMGKIFEEKLQRKTGWGRNEVLSIFKESIIEALVDNLDEVDPIKPDESKSELQSRYLRHKKRVK
jgi:hypothetical protein